MGNIYKYISAVLFMVLFVTLPLSRFLEFDPYWLVLSLLISAVVLLKVSSCLSENKMINKKVILLRFDWLVVYFWLSLNILLSWIRQDLGDLPMVSIISCISFCKIMTWDPVQKSVRTYELTSGYLYLIKIVRVVIIVFAIFILIDLAPFVVSSKS